MKQLTRIKKWIKKHPRIYLMISFFIHKETRVQWILRRIRFFPQLHVNFLIKHSVMYGYGTLFPRAVEVDLSDPQLFNEKTLWLKYYKYNRSELVVKCYDKYTVREYVEESGCGEILNELYGVWDDVDDIPWESLPDEYIIKKTNGCGNHIFKIKGSSFDKKNAIAILKQSDFFEKIRFLSSADLFATRSKQKYICERLLKPEEGEERVADYKFFCFNGVPKYLNYIWNRSMTDKNSYRETFKEIDLQNPTVLTDRSGYILHATDESIVLPKCFDKMIQVCQKLSKPFPFVRVDLYSQGDKVVFGELTFTPEGGHMLDHVFKEDNNINLEGLEVLGSQIKLVDGGDN